MLSNAFTKSEGAFSIASLTNLVFKDSKMRNAARTYFTISICSELFIFLCSGLVQLHLGFYELSMRGHSVFSPSLLWLFGVLVALQVAVCSSHPMKDIFIRCITLVSVVLLCCLIILHGIQSGHLTIEGVLDKVSNIQISRRGRKSWSSISIILLTVSVHAMTPFFARQLGSERRQSLPLIMTKSVLANSVVQLLLAFCIYVALDDTTKVPVFLALEGHKLLCCVFLFSIVIIGRSALSLPVVLDAIQNLFFSLDEEETNESLPLLDKSSKVSCGKDSSKQKKSGDVEILASSNPSFYLTKKVISSNGTNYGAIHPATGCGVPKAIASSSLPIPPSNTVNEKFNRTRAFLLFLVLTAAFFVVALLPDFTFFLRLAGPLLALQIAVILPITLFWQSRREELSLSQKLSYLSLLIVSATGCLWTLAHANTH